MLSVDQTGKITKWVNGKGTEIVNFDESTKKELLLVVAAKLHSIRGMLMFFTFITVFSLIIVIFSLSLR